MGTMQRLETDLKSLLYEMNLTETSIRSNFHRLFGGHECDILAKMIYLFLANGKDYIHINFVTFAENMMPLLVSTISSYLALIPHVSCLIESIMI
jgi:hypothetical protein